MGTDFENVPTKQLASETLLRAKDVDQINEAAWSTAGWAFVSVAAGMAVGGVFFIFLGQSIFWSLAAALAVCAWPWWRWEASIRQCKGFTREMVRRRRELQSR